MIVAYDLDGVLAVNPPMAEKSWRFMNGIERSQRKEFLSKFYKNAQKLYEPKEEKFVVITARKSEHKNVTVFWLKENFPERIGGLYMLSTSRTIENVIIFKSGVLRKIGASCFVEDNIKVVKGLRKVLPEMEIKLFPQEVLNG